MTFDPTRNAISSLDWGSGRCPSDALGGLTSVEFGQALAPANLSHRRAKAMGLTMSGTYGQRSTISSRSAALRRFAESRLQARTATLGSTLYKLTWKAWDTPFGRSFSLLRASAVRTKDTGNSGSPWPTPQHHDATGRSKSQKALHGTKHGCACLVRQADLTSWPTPDAALFNLNSDLSVTQARRSRLKETHGNGNGAGLVIAQAVQLASWPTSRAADAEKAVRTTEGAANETLRKGSPQPPGPAASLSSWSTPTSRDHKDGPLCPNVPINALLGRDVWLTGWASPTASCRERSDETITKGEAHRLAKYNKTSLPMYLNDIRLLVPQGPARLTVHGEMRTGFTARMDGGDRLNPEHSRWLMACPPEWAFSAPGWSDWQLWQGLMQAVSNEQNLTESEP